MAVAFVVAGCNGGGSTAPAPPKTTAPTPTPSPAPVSTTQAIPTNGGTITLPTTGGYSASFAVAAGAPSGTVTSTETTVAPSNAPAPSSALRRPAAVVGQGALFYVTLQFSVSVPVSYFTGGTFTVPIVASGVSYEIEIDDITATPATVLGDIGPLTFSGTTGTWVSGGGGGQTLLAGHTYLFQLFEESPAPSPTPTPAATATPSGTATPTPTASPTTHPTATPTASPTATPNSSPTPLGVTFTGGTSGAQTSNPSTGNVSVDASDSDGTGTFVQATFGGGSPASYQMTGYIADKDAQITPISAWTTNGGPGDLSGGDVYAMVTPSVSIDLTSISITFGSPNISSGQSCTLYGVNWTGSVWAWNALAAPVTVTTPQQVTFTVTSGGQNNLNIAPNTTNIIGVACTGG
jgi:hypothetical protein